MKPLIIKSTEITPSIEFNPDTEVYEIGGESRPESVREFYEPILTWLDNYAIELSKRTDLIKNENFSIKMNFKLEYFNSSSAKYFLDILKKMISKFHNQGINVKVFWYYEDGDDDMQEAGEELSHMVKFPFKYIAVKSKYSSKE